LFKKITKGRKMEGIIRGNGINCTTSGSMQQIQQKFKTITIMTLITLAPLEYPTPSHTQEIRSVKQQLENAHQYLAFVRDSINRSCVCDSFILVQAKIMREIGALDMALARLVSP
jgi:hypothetical protein